MGSIMDYIKAFAVGGMLCVIGQVLIDCTKLTPARILTSYVVAGVVLGALGIYQPLADFALAGALCARRGKRAADGLRQCAGKRRARGGGGIGAAGRVHGRADRLRGRHLRGCVLCADNGACISGEG